jgi:imidazole glycerol-phosphate synthase subunit HisH
MTLGIIDYGAGNLRSVVNALRAIGHESEIIASPSDVKNATHLILPGQGEFRDCMERLEKRGLAHFLHDWIAADQPYFGICVGYQILFDASEEAPGRSGLGVIPGTVRRFTAEPGLKIPHMGWNAAALTHSEAPIWRGLQDQPYFYYVHSYFPEPADCGVIAAKSTYGTQTFAGAIQRGNLFATQFHPEKSQQAGLQLLENFATSSSVVAC